jgi:hypothetical protein
MGLQGNELERAIKAAQTGVVAIGIDSVQFWGLN